MGNAPTLTGFGDQHITFLSPPYLKMVPYGGIEPTTSQFVAECSVRYTNRAFEIGTVGGIRTLKDHSF